MEDQTKVGSFQPHRVLIVVKQTLKARIDASDDEGLKKLLAAESDQKERIETSDQEHNATLAHVISVLTEKGIQSRCIERQPGEHFDIEDEELVITVGGDGTFLDAAHSVRSPVPMLGINSAPSTSFGHFCLTDRNSFAAIADQILAGTRKPVSLTRLQLVLDGTEIDIPVLNELLIAHPNPAGTARYRLEVDNRSASHKSSGLIVSTASGSTGFMRSAGGPVLDITDTSFGFWVDKPFKNPGVPFPLRGETLSNAGKMLVTSEMIEGRIFIDGAHIARDFNRGSKLTIAVHAVPLLAYVDADCHDRFKESD